MKSTGRGVESDSRSGSIDRVEGLRFCGGPTYFRARRFRGVEAVRVTRLIAPLGATGTVVALEIHWERVRCSSNV